MFSRALLVNVLIFGTLATANAEVVFSSGPDRVALLELYTSEGCNSCPPADRWLSSLTKNRALWREVVPIALHVDYWDYIGWEDRFAEPEFTRRQQAHAIGHGLRTIYTPGFVLNGNEWRGWRSGQPVAFAGGADAGELEVAVAGGVVRISYRPSQGVLVNPRANVALLGFGLTSEVRAGENAGRNLTHDFVVLELVEQTLGHDGRHYHGEIKLPTTDFLASRFGIATWVSAGGHPAPVQAVGGWLPKDR